MKEYSVTALIQAVTSKVRAVRETMPGNARWIIQTIVDQKPVLTPVNDYHHAMQEVALRRFLLAIQMLGRTPEQVSEDMLWYESEMGDWKTKLVRFIAERQLVVTLSPRAQQTKRRAAYLENSNV